MGESRWREGGAEGAGKGAAGGAKVEVKWKGAEYRVEEEGRRLLEV